MASDTPLLQVQGLQVNTDSGQILLQDIHLRIDRGSALGVVGASGSGKSMLARALLDLLPASCRRSGGSIEWGGRSLERPGALASLRGSEIAYVFQDAASSLHPLRRVGAQLHECWRVHRRRLQMPAQQAVERSLRAVGLEPRADLLRAYPHQLSGGQRQRVMLALTLLPAPALLIADEVTSALDPVLASRVCALLQDSVQRLGVALIFIAHDLARVADLCGEIAVLEHGAIVEQGPAHQLLRHPRTAAGQRLLAAQGGPAGAFLPDPQAAPLIEARALSASYPDGAWWPRRRQRPALLQGIDLAILPGQRLGVVGASGSGKSTLALALQGLLPIAGGELLWFGRSLSVTPARQLRAWRPRVQMVFQDPFRSLDPLQRIDAMLAEALGYAPADADSATPEGPENLLHAVGLEANAMRRYPSQFSGGQRQRLAIARALALRPQLLICDEATSALDSAIQAQIIDLLAQLSSERGLALLFITHDLRALARLCPKLIVIDQGRIVEHGNTEQCLQTPQSAALRGLVGALPGVLATESARWEGTRAPNGLEGTRARGHEGTRA